MKYPPRFPAFFLLLPAAAGSKDEVWPDPVEYSPDFSRTCLPEDGQKDMQRYF